MRSSATSTSAWTSYEAVSEIGEIGMNRMIDAIRDDMERLEVRYDEWFSEQSLYDSGQFATAMAMLETRRT